MASFIQVFRQTKIYQLDLKVIWGLFGCPGISAPYPVLIHVTALHHDILRFQVKVNDASLVNKVQGFDDLSHKLDADFFI